jgi:hypothetical protein
MTEYAKHADAQGRIKDVDEFIADERADAAAAEAEALYTQRKRDIAAVLDWLELELEKHDEYARKEGLTFAHAGDLGELRRQLIQALAFLAQRDETDIEDALADAQAGREQTAAKEADATIERQLREDMGLGIDYARQGDRESAFACLTRCTARAEVLGAMGKEDLCKAALAAEAAIRKAIDSRPARPTE